MVSWFSIGMALCLGYICSIQARQRKRSPYRWFCIGFLLGWIGLIILVMLPTCAKAQHIPAPCVVEIPLFGWFFVDKRHAVQGPCSLAELDQELALREDAQNMWVWHETLVQWHQVRQYDPLTSRIVAH